MALAGRYLVATKQSDGTVYLEFAKGNFPLSTERTVITLTSAEATALSNVIAGGTGTTATCQHGQETNAKYGDR